MQPELVLEPSDAEARRVGRDDEGADLGVAAWSVVAGPRGDDVRAGLAGVGDEPLAAVDDPRAAVGAVFVPGGRARPAGVAAGAGLGQAVGAEHLALGHRDEEALLLLVRAGEVERPAAEAGVGGDDEPERAPDAADLLDRDRVGEGVEAGAALVLGDRDAEPAELADAATMSVGKRRSRSCSSTTGATSVSMKSRIVSRSRACSAGRSRSTRPSLPPPRAPRSPVLAFPDDARAERRAPRARPRPAPVAEPPRRAADAVRGWTSGLRREILIRLRHDGPSSPERLATASA